jgi:hypothetical protein
VRDGRCLPPLPPFFVGVGGVAEGVVGAVDVAGGRLGDGERVLGGRVAAGAGKQRRRLGGMDERVGADNSIPWFCVIAACRWVG